MRCAWTSSKTVVFNYTVQFYKNDNIFASNRSYNAGQQQFSSATFLPIQTYRTHKLYSSIKYVHNTVTECTVNAQYNKMYILYTQLIDKARCGQPVRVYTQPPYDILYTALQHFIRTHKIFFRRPATDDTKNM